MICDHYPYILEDESVTGTILKNAVAAIFPPATLFRENLRAFIDLQTELKNLLDRSEGNITQNSSLRTLMTLASNLYQMRMTRPLQLGS